jgi:hypothetical protein
MTAKMRTKAEQQESAAITEKLEADAQAQLTANAEKYNPRAAAQNRMLKILEGTPDGISKSMLFAQARCNYPNGSQAINALYRAGKVQIDVDGASHVCRLRPEDEWGSTDAPLPRRGNTSTVQELALVQTLAAEPEGLTGKEIAAALKLSPITATAIARRMEAAGQLQVGIGCKRCHCRVWSLVTA